MMAFSTVKLVFDPSDDEEDETRVMYFDIKRFAS
jgi:hypothetical protein